MSAGTLRRSEARCKGLVPASTLTVRALFVTVLGTFDRVSAHGDLAACIEARLGVSFESHPLVRELQAQQDAIRLVEATEVSTRESSIRFFAVWGGSCEAHKGQAHPSASASLAGRRDGRSLVNFGSGSV